MQMKSQDDLLLDDTRRHFFRRCGIGIGQIALASLLNDREIYGATAKPSNPMAARPPMFPPRVRNVIFMHMAGGPSQLELFDHKPKLAEYDGKVAPEELIKGKRFAFMDTFTKAPPRLLGNHREFRQYGQSGLWVSSLM